MDRFGVPFDTKNVGGWVVSGLGVALAGLSLWYILVIRAFTISSNLGLWGVVLQGLEILLLALFSLVLVYGGYWLASSPFETNRVWWAGLWTIIGLTGIVTIVTLANSLQFIHGEELPEPTVIQTMLLAAGGGAFAGLLIGVSTIRETAEAERAHRHRHSLEFVNELLRHNVLNGMQVIQSYTRELEDHVDESGEDHLDVVQERADTIVELIANVRVLMESISSDYSLMAVDLSAVVSDTVATARDTYPHAEFDTDVPAGVCVDADDLLAAVFENLLSNAVEHSDTDHPRVNVSVEERAETVVVKIADDGPGIPESKQETYFEPGEQGEGSFGQGLGLYLVDTLVDTYDGDVWMEDNEPRGTVVHVELHRSDSS